MFEERDFFSMRGSVVALIPFSQGNVEFTKKTCAMQASSIVTCDRRNLIVNYVTPDLYFDCTYFVANVKKFNRNFTHLLTFLSFLRKQESSNRAMSAANTFVL